MDQELLDRLKNGVAGLLQRNRQLEEECCSLKQAQKAWNEERSQLLAEVERILGRLEHLDRGEP